MSTNSSYDDRGQSSSFMDIDNSDSEYAILKQALDELVARGAIAVHIRNGNYYYGIRYRYQPSLTSHNRFNRIAQDQWKHEQLIQQKYAIYELTKVRWRNKEDPQFSENNIHPPGVFGPLIFAKISRHYGRRMSNNIDNIVGVEYSDPKSESHLQHQQSTRLVKGSDNTAVNKSKPSKKAKGAHKVTKTNVSKKQVDTELQQSRQRWESERDVIARIVQLGQKLGHPPTYLDLYCAGFEPVELDAISDLLQPLLASDDDANVIPWAESGAPLELVMV